MNKTVNISNDKKSILEFDIEVSGAVEDDMAVRFIIESEGMALGFDSKKETGDTWSVEIPAMRILDKTIYPFYISVIVDGYTFEGLRGSVNVIGDRKVHVSDPVLVPAKAKKKVVKKQETKEETKASVIKPNKKTIGTPAPLKMKPSAEALKDLNAKKRKTEPKKEVPLDDKTLDLINKAKAEVKDTTKRVEDKKIETKKEKSKPTGNVVTKKTTPKKKVTEETKIPPVIDDISVPLVIDDISVPPVLDDVTVPVILTEENTPARLSAKAIAKNLIKSVTGIGNTKNKNIANEEQNQKVKDILKEEPVEKEKRTKPSRKKVIRGKDILEVNAIKEDDIKKILDEETRSVTTTPINKKLH